ncbi:hypothetical protein HUS23_03440 [Ectothiorhodospiraceae bacterium 2226]|nr:hypothetical protein HUS23_03440 [Ectothiorhodospiraceae bacterium 2226]
MKNKLIGGVVGGAALLWSSTAVWAGTVIELRDAEGVEQRILVEQELGRFESDDGRRYVLLDVSEKRFLLVDNEQRAVFDMSVMLQEAPPESVNGPADEPTVEAVEQGPGPEIAGFATQHFVLQADGQPCQEVYVSRELLEQAGLVPFLAAFGDLARYTRELEGEGAPDTHPCERMEPSVELMALGMPLRTVGPGGELEEEVVEVRADVALPEDAFALPQDYQVIVFGSPDPGAPAP